MKTLCVYYSLNNHVHQLVENLPDVTLLRLQTTKKLPRNKFWQMMYLGYLTTKQKELAIQPTAEDVDAFDHIIIATPMWAGKLALPIVAWLKTHHFQNKQVTCFVSCAGQDGGKLREQLESLLDESNTLTDFTVYGGR